MSMYPIHHNPRYYHLCRLSVTERTFTAGRPPYARAGYLTGDFRKLWPRCAFDLRFLHLSGSVPSDTITILHAQWKSHLCLLFSLVFRSNFRSIQSVSTFLINLISWAVVTKKKEQVIAVNKDQTFNKVWYVTRQKVKSYTTRLRTILQ